MKKKKAPLVILFGRTNVGKSTIFNTLTESQTALVSDIDGTTRDANFAKVSWRNIDFRLADTAGIIEQKLIKKYTKSEDFDIEKQVQEQAQNILKEAKLILFVVDVRDGLLPDDKTLAKNLKKLKNKKIVLVANKADSPSLRKEAVEFHKLGLGEPLAISATTGSGTGDLLDEVFDILKDHQNTTTETDKNKRDQEGDENEIKVTVLGKPNVGKSSLINKLAGEKKQIVSHIAHTTREPNDILINHKDENIRLIDTAGMHRKGLKNVKKIKEQQKLERLSIQKSLRTLARADIALLMIDIKEGITQQEAKICEAIVKNKCSLIIVANKWDMIEERDTKYYTLEINRHFPYATWAPIQFISAKTGEKIKHLKNLILEVNKQRQIELNDNVLSKFLKQVIKHHRPVKSKGTKKPYIHTFKQTQVTPPKFTLKIGAKDTVHDSYLKFMENQLRQKFGFLGAPITIYVEKNRQIHGQHEQFLKNKKEDKKTEDESIDSDDLE